MERPFSNEFVGHDSGTAESDCAWSRLEMLAVASGVVLVGGAYVLLNLYLEWAFVG
jgi:hypothetical protein